MTPQRVVDRTLRKVDRDEATGCLVSRYSVGSHGYAQVGWHDHELGKTVMRLCHRVAWEAANGPIPEGMTVDHEECHNRKCIELTHLRLLTNLENARRNQPGRNWDLGTCIRGHDTSHWKPKGEQRMKGYCAECRREKRGKP